MRVVDIKVAFKKRRAQLDTYIPWSLLSMVVLVNIGINSFLMQYHVSNGIEKIIRNKVHWQWGQDGHLISMGYYG